MVMNSSYCDHCNVQYDGEIELIDGIVSRFYETQYERRNRIIFIVLGDTSNFRQPPRQRNGTNRPIFVFTLLAIDEKRYC